MSVKIVVELGSLFECRAPVAKQVIVKKTLDLREQQLILHACYEISQAKQGMS